MKKVLSIIIILLSVLLITSCSQSSPPKEFPPPEGYDSWEQYEEERNEPVQNQTPTPAQEPTTTTTTTSAPEQPELTLQIVSVTSPVSAGANATLVAQTVAGANCDIDVYYKSGASKAQGLYPKTANNSGKVSWTWTVGTRTTPGDWGIVVRASYGGETVIQSTYFTVY